MASNALLLTRRLLLCAAFGALVAGLAYVSVWQADISDQTSRTRKELKDLRKALENYRQANGNYPDRLSELRNFKPERVYVDENGDYADGWRHPYQYSREGEGFLLFSFGKDGKPGGEGQDADLFGLDHREGHPTFRQFVEQKHAAAETKICCALAGLVAFVLALILGIGRPGSRLVWPKLAVTAAMCIFVGCNLSVIHRISGH